MASPPITFSGLASGLDTGALVEALIEIERLPIDRLERQKSDLQSEDALVQDLNTRLAALRDAAAGLDNLNSTLGGPSLDEEFFRFAAASGDDTVLAAEATGVPTPGSFDVEVVSLATAARVVTNAVADTVTPFGNEGDSVTVDFGGAAPIVVTVPAGGISYDGLRDAINTHVDNDGSVQASVLDDGSGGFRLVIAGASTGAAHDITVTEAFTDGTDLVDESAGQAAADAALRVFGVDVVRPANTIADLIDGVTLELSAPGTTTITIDRDYSAMGEALQEFADAYNAFRNFFNDQSRVNELTERAGPLSGDPVLRGVETGIRGALGAAYGADTDAFRYLSDLGLRFDEDGLLNFDAVAFQEAIDADDDLVRQRFSDAAGALGQFLQPVLQSGDGLIAARLSGIDSQISRIDDQVARLEVLVASREETLRRQFTQLESLLATLSAQSGFLSRIGQPTSGQQQS